MIENRSIRVSISLLSVFVGSTLALYTRNNEGTIFALGYGIGLALVVTGFISIFQEIVIGPTTAAKFDQQKEDIISESRIQANRIMEEVKLLARPGLRILANRREGDSRYYAWILENYPQEVFFAGHSVLHRIQADFKDRKLPDVDSALPCKVSEGSRIRILFLDPTWDLLDYVAKAGGQDPAILKEDLLETLEICRKLSVALKDNLYPGGLEIRTCREVAQYAYHYVECGRRNTCEMLLGFYFAHQPGIENPLLGGEDKDLRKLFKDHFDRLFRDARPLLSYTRHSLDFRESYYADCVASLKKHRG